MKNEWKFTFFRLINPHGKQLYPTSIHIFQVDSAYNWDRVHDTYIPTLYTELVESDAFSLELISGHVQSSEGI